MHRRAVPGVRGVLPRLTLALWAGAGWAVEGPAQTPPLSGVEVLGQVTLSLILVVALLLALAWALRRLNRLQPQGAGGLRLLGGLSLGARERILLVEAEGRRVLVGVSPGGLRTLLVLDGGARTEAGQQGAAGVPDPLPGATRRLG
jgi:flagellar protein FliO/FliZ